MIRGSRYKPEKNRFTWREDWERTDEEENLPEGTRMGKICLEAMNSVNEDLTFTVHEFQNGIYTKQEKKQEKEKEKGGGSYFEGRRF
jgi:hypothetical protein